MSTQINCLGFDPAYAKPTAWAHRDIDGVWQTGLTRTKNEDGRGFYLDLLKAVGVFEVNTVVCENVYMGRNSAVVAGLSRVQGNIEGAAIGACCCFELPGVTTGAKALPAMDDGKRPRKRKEIIQGAIQFAAALTGRGDLSEDESVAVCIAHWGNENLKAEGE